jgi:hypothetical protein
MIEVAAAANGTLTYLIHGSPAALPPVRRRDLLGAWDAARTAALAAGGAGHAQFGRHGQGQSRAFRFARPDGGTTDLALSDPDARCWAHAVDHRTPIASPYGLSLCLRLLALVDLLAASPWARAHVALRPGGAELAPRLVRLAAEAKLTDDASFDEAAFRACLAPTVTTTKSGAPLA